MSKGEPVLQLEELFRETGEAHHDAFSEIGGEDREWPLWCAAHLKDEPQEILEVASSKSQLVYFLITASNEQQTRAPGVDWAHCYARFFRERYI